MAYISKIKLPEITEPLVIKDAEARQMIGSLPAPMQFKGTLGVGGTISELPAASSENAGYTYKVITAGTYAGKDAKVGDVFISNGTEWVLIPSGDEPSGTVTNIATGTGLTGGPITDQGTISIDTTVVATKTDINNIRQVSTGGTSGQVLTRNSSGGYGWSTVSSSLTQDDYLSAQEMKDIMGEDTFWNGEMV